MYMYMYRYMYMYIHIHIHIHINGIDPLNDASVWGKKNKTCQAPRAPSMARISMAHTTLRRSWEWGKLKSGDSSRHVCTYKSGTHKIERFSGVFWNPETSKRLDRTRGSCFVIVGSLDPFAPGMLKSYKRAIKSWSIINAGSLFDVQLPFGNQSWTWESTT